MEISLSCVLGSYGFLDPTHFSYPSTVPAFFVGGLCPSGALLWHLPGVTFLAEMTRRKSSPASASITSNLDSSFPCHRATSHLSGCLSLMSTFGRVSYKHPSYLDCAHLKTGKTEAVMGGVFLYGECGDCVIVIKHEGLITSVGFLKWQRVMEFCCCSQPLSGLAPPRLYNLSIWIWTFTCLHWWSWHCEHGPQCCCMWPAQRFLPSPWSSSFPGSQSFGYGFIWEAQFNTGDISNQACTFGMTSHPSVWILLVTMHLR